MGFNGAFYALRVPGVSLVCKQCILLFFLGAELEISRSHKNAQSCQNSGHMHEFSQNDQKMKIEKRVKCA